MIPRTPRAFALLILPLTTSLALPAQQPAAPASAVHPASESLPATLSWPSDRVFTDVPADDTVWATAGDWKAAFTAAGLEFLVASAADAAAVRATFALATVRCGGEPMPTAAARPVLRGQRVSYERGVVIESFDLRADGIEQQWRFDALPTRGALELEIAVGADLAVTPTSGGHLLTTPAAGISYGRATAIDALGNRAALVTEWTGSTLRITVPPSFVAAAALPLVVDPLIGTVGSTGSSIRELTATDIAADATLGQYYVTYERAYSATDHDVYLAWFDQAMQPQGMLAIDLTTDTWVRPRVATLEMPDRGCVVAQVSTGNQSPFTVRGRLFAGGVQTTVTAPWTIAGTAVVDCLAPDIGGDADPVGPSRFLVAYESQGSSVNNSTAWCRTFDFNGYMLSSQSLPSPIGFEQGIAVSKSCGVHGSGNEGWALVHRHYDYQAVNGKLYAWFVDRTGAIHDPVGTTDYVELTGLTLNLGSEWDVSSPTTGQNGPTFLVAETRVNVLTSRGAIFGHVIDYQGNILAADVPLAVGGDRRSPSVDCDGRRFVMANENRYTGGDVDVQVSTLAFLGGQLHQQDTDTVSFDPTADFDPTICAVPVAGLNHYGLAWINQTNGNWTVRARPYLGVAAGGFTVRATGCGNLNTITLGEPQIGHSFAVGLTNVTGLAGFLAGAPVSWTVGPCPTCLQGVNGSALVTSMVQVNVPGDPGLVGVTLALQGWQFDPAGGPCLGQVSLGDTIDFTVQ
ncbi:MAG: hypothetical protein KDC98_22775 [Planctomycetes bacterium]|nr:hypothetical protein [Planctomycetota bacterium]